MKDHGKGSGTLYQVHKICWSDKPDFAPYGYGVRLIGWRPAGLGGHVPLSRAPLDEEVVERIVYQRLQDWGLLVEGYYRFFASGVLGASTPIRVPQAPKAFYISAEDANAYRKYNVTPADDGEAQVCLPRKPTT